ncbi:hypothetical protein [Treponema endosymbiont of Eucomonympha sp.]|uniref:hypothetical protein n=1 Tax=Treponema endosymbiont of Eucomonympha sp. TaxID=1580831 RepID=UPI001396B252|nr:hypothetical protein [Treponema endosymbiont of Eucomonympha sp.]
MPDAAKEERLVTAWLKKMAQQNDRLNQALREQIPEMIREHGRLRPPARPLGSPAGGNRQHIARQAR